MSRRPATTCPRLRGGPAAALLAPACWALELVPPRGLGTAGGALSEFGELLELMHGATGRVRSVQATLIERRRPELLERAFRRFAERTEFARGGGYFHVPLGGVAPGEQADEHLWRIELWAETGRFRQERWGPDAEHVLVVDGERWWDWSPAFGLRSHGDDRGVHHHGGLDLLDASEFLGGYALEPSGEAVAAGRPTRRMGVRSISSEHRPFGLELGIEEAELLVDAERGLVLRRAELVDGEEALVREVEQISYDETLPGTVFVFELPPGASARGRAEPQVTTIDAAATLASFRVFKLEPVPPEWRMQAVYVAATKRPALPDSVTLLYSRPDGGQCLQIRETTREHELPAIGGERHFERGGHTYTALGPERPAGREPAELIFAIDGTQIRMSSSELSLEQLLERAEQLVVA